MLSMAVHRLLRRPLARVISANLGPSFLPTLPVVQACHLMQPVAQKLCSQRNPKPTLNPKEQLLLSNHRATWP